MPKLTAPEEDIAFHLFQEQAHDMIINAIYEAINELNDKHPDWHFIVHDVAITVREPLPTLITITNHELES